MKKKTKIKYVIAAAVPIMVLIGLIVLSFDPARDAVLTAVAGFWGEQTGTEAEPSQTPVSSQEIRTLNPEPISTPEPTPLPEPAFQEYDITLLALGDNLMHMGIVKTGKKEDGTYDFSFLFDNIRDYLDAADIKVINQETILGGNELGFSGFPRFNSPTETGDAIAEAGFNVVLHATNHAADQGLNGILNCSAYWAASHPEVLMTGITGEKTTASAKNEDSTGYSEADARDIDSDTENIPLLQVGEVTFAILNYTYGPNAETLSKSLMGHLNMLCAYNEKNGRIDFTSLNPQVPEEIKAAEELADVVIVFPHWGTEYQKTPSAYQQKFAREMTLAGADLIIGTHPHVPQPVEKITAENGNTALCFYSLGNYVSTQKDPLCMLEEMAWITFHVTEEGVTIAEEQTGVLPLVCHYKSGPLRLENVYFLEDYTEEQAARHGIRSYGGKTLRLSDLQTWCDEIIGSWVLKKSDILLP